MRVTIALMTLDWHHSHREQANADQLSSNLHTISLISQKDLGASVHLIRAEVLNAII